MTELFSIRCIKKGFLAISFTLLICVTLYILLQKKVCETKECLIAAHNLRESMDIEVNPCDDFYKYACGNFPKVHSHFGNSAQLRYVRNYIEILHFLQQKNKNDEPEAVHKARKLFDLCMNEAAYSDSLDKIYDILRKIGLSINSSGNIESIENFDYTTALARAVKLSESALYFAIGVLPNPFNLTVNTIVLMAGSRSYQSKAAANPIMNEETKRICADNTSKSCKRLLSQLNFSEHLKAAKNVKRESEVSENGSESTFSQNRELPVIYTLKQLQAFTDNIAAELNAKIPKLNWTRYIEEIFKDLENIAVDLDDPDNVKITIHEFDSFKDAIQLLYKNNTTKKIAYELHSKVVETLKPYVSSTYRTEKDCIDLSIQVLGMAVSYVYTSTEQHIKTKAEVSTIFEHIRKAFQQLLQQASWMDEMTRQRALKKLHRMRSFIAYPSIIKTTPQFLNDLYKDVKITNNIYDTVISFKQNEVKENLKTINQINDPLENQDWSWSSPPTDVNGYYVKGENAMVIPAGILGIPFYNNGLYALDYGAIGSIVGHELTHAFDNEGRHFNEIGNIENWWQPETANVYREKSKCFVKAYGNYSIALNDTITLTVNGEKTLGENLSDNVGFKESLLAYRKCTSEYGEELLLPKFENFSHEQLFTLAFANIWCANPYFYNLDNIESDVHSLSEFRVNGVLQNSKQFSEIWKCPKGSKMNPVADKCELW